MKFLLKTFFACATLWLSLTSLSLAIEPTQEELDARKVWVTDHLGSADAALPFSFVYDGVASSEFLKSWYQENKIENLDENRVQHTLIFVDPAQQLQVTCQAIEYLDFPTVEWVLHFKNLSDSDTKIVENIQAIDTTFERDNEEMASTSWWDIRFGDVLRENRQKEFILHEFPGAGAYKTDYSQEEIELGGGANVSYAPKDGRGLACASAYYNIQANKKGWIVVLGWPGQWKTTFQRVDACGLHVLGGQELTHFKLLPGEDVRSPSVVVQPWIRDTWFDAQNVWRAWMIRYIVPKQPDGSVVTNHIAACSSHFFAEMTQANTDCQKLFIDRYLEEGIQLDYWWMDAGWYPCEGNWQKTGTWEVDETRFPGGFRPITDYARSKGVKTIVWFEPERVTPGTWINDHHPEWLLNAECYKNMQGTSFPFGFFDFGNPEALDWLINHIDGLIKKEGIDLYRQDCNFGPLEGWRANDAPDRQGIHEIKYVQGYLKYWDSLLERNPGLRIDSCAGGGHRNEFETMRRAVPLLRSDLILEPVTNQNHALGIPLWIPYQGTALRTFNDYNIRSTLAPYQNFCFDIREKVDYSNVLRNLEIRKNVLIPVYDKDYYPLTQPAPFRNDVWIGWQFNDPNAGIGAIQMFRRLESTATQGQFPLFGLDGQGQYEFTDCDSGKTWTVSGEELMKKGVVIDIPERSSAIILAYKKVQ